MAQTEHLMAETIPLTVIQTMFFAQEIGILA